MKRILLVAAIAAAFLSCSKKDEPTQVQNQEDAIKHEVTFCIPGLAVETQPMSAPAIRKTPVLTDDDGNQMTDLIVWDGSTYLMRQQNTEANFGTVTLMLTTGEHHLHFIATRSTGLLVEGGLLTCTNLRPTFGKHYDINVTGGSEQNLNMDRITGQVSITIEDAIPAGAKNLRVQFGDHYTSIDPTTFNASRTGAFDQTINISSKVGTTNNNWKVNVLVPTYGTEINTTYTLTATDTDDKIIGQCTGTMPLNSNTKTLLHGNLFTGTKSMFALSTSWNADEDVTF